jgi:hypothetical protein
VTDTTKISNATVANPLTAVLGSADDHLIGENGFAESKVPEIFLSETSDGWICGGGGIDTLICGAPHCGQKGVPAETSELQR